MSATCVLAARGLSHLLLTPGPPGGKLPGAVGGTGSAPALSCRRLADLVHVTICGDDLCNEGGYLS